MFYSAEHEANFHQAGVRTRAGGPDAATCGARTRTGGSCGALPIAGSNRCVRYCGPHAAKAYRERQRQAFRAGKLSVEDWNRAEGKRALNRLRERWKKDPWAAGSTIDLGEHEVAFLDESGLAVRLKVEPMPPAVLDWLRWRYRRLKVDRKRDQEWTRVLREQLPARLSVAGPAPEFARSVAVGPVPLWTVEDACAMPKRSLPDVNRVPAVRALSFRGRGRPRKPPADMTEEEETALALFVSQHRDTLRPMFERSPSAQHRHIVETLRAFIADPNDLGACNAWTRLVMALRAG